MAIELNKGFKPQGINLRLKGTWPNYLLFKIYLLRK